MSIVASSLLALSLVTPGASPAPAPVEDHGKLPWFEGTFEEVLARAAAEEKLVFLDFWTDWCSWCKRLDRDTFSDDSVVAEMADFLVYSVDAESASGRPVAQRFNVRGFPSLIVLGPDGKPRDKIGGYLPPEDFKREIQRVRRSEGTIDALARKVQGAPDDLDGRWELAVRQRELGQSAAYQAQVTAIHERDPKSLTHAGQSVGLEEATATVPAIWQKTRKIDTSEVERFLGTATYPDILHRGWAYIAGTRHREAQQLANRVGAARLGDLRRMSRDAYRRAWITVAVGDLTRFGTELASTFVAHGPELNDDDRAFALRVARIAVAANTGQGEAQARGTLAGCLDATGDLEGAARELERCQTIDPKNPVWQRQLKAVRARAQSGAGS